MKTIQEQKFNQQQNTQRNVEKDEENSQRMSLSASCASGYQDSIQSFRGGKYYASFSFRFRNKPSFEMSSYLSEGEQIRMEQFFQDEIIFERKVERKDVVFRPGCLNSKFIKHATQIIYRFCTEANEMAFFSLLKELSSTEIPIFQPVKEDSEFYTLNQSLQDLFYRKQYTFLIHTFDWSICHLTFVCCLLIYWMQIQIQDPFQDQQQQRNPKRRQYISQQKIKLKQNICYISLSYAQQRSQEINTNQPVLLILYNFLNFLKRQPCLNIVQISLTQDKLINDIKLFRRIKRKQKEFQSTINQIIFQSQLHKYQFENKLITSQEKTYTLLKLICIHNFVSCPLLKYYQLDQYKESRHLYQNKKDLFCVWVLNIILNECQRKKMDSIHNAALYILTFMGILKKMKKSSNLQGISYLLPILANIKIHIPKVWEHAKKRRPQIEKKLNQYERKLMRKQYKTEQLSQGNAIIWGETIYDLARKMQKFLGTKEHIEIEEHRKFYEQFLVHFLHYRRNLQKQYKQQIQKYNRDKEIGSSFNMYFLDTYIPRMYESKNLEEEWKKFIRRAQMVNKNISTSFYNNVLDYCFVGSTPIFQKMEI